MIKLRAYFESFAPISESTWCKVQPIFQLTQLKKGDYFIREGQRATQFAFVQSGVIRAFFRDQRGKEYNKHFFVSPSIAGGYSSLITGQPSPIFQQALTDCKLLRATYSDLTSLYDTCPDLERVGRRFAELYFVEKELKEAQIVLTTAEERYALFQQQFPHLDQQITQYHIASYLGITPTQLSRIRKKLTRSPISLPM